MHSKFVASTLPAVAASVFVFILVLKPLRAVAQSPASESATTWQDLGFGSLPATFSTDAIPLFEGLNQSRGRWSFEAETSDGETLAGSLHIAGNPKSGMIPVWKMAWSWPADDPKRVVNDMIMASPRDGEFELMLVRVGPIKKTASANGRPANPPTMFSGKWNRQNRTITWIESDRPSQLAGQSPRDPSEPRQKFEMVIAANGSISLQNSTHLSDGLLATGKATVRKAEAPAEAITLTGKHEFRTVTEIADRRIKPCIPPQATEISLLSERGGHFARYKVGEKDFVKFLDELWEAKKDSSAHKRETMSGEGEPASKETMSRRFKFAGWKPLDNAITYYSPSKSNGAITTYYYDSAAGIAYHDTGYW